MHASSCTINLALLTLTLVPQLYAEKQFPGNPEQQAVLIHQLQREHYHQYMQQLHLQNQNQNQNQNTEDKGHQEAEHVPGNNNNSSTDLPNAMEGLKLGEVETQQHQQLAEQQDGHVEQTLEGVGQEQHGEEEYDDYVMICPAKIWTRPDIEQFKTEVSAGDGDGVITIGHGDTVTVGGNQLMTKQGPY